MPYAAALAAVEADPRKPTAASEAWATFDPAAFARDPHAIVQGFTDHQLFANKGFKLGVALRAAGVHQSAAAAAAVKAACPVRPAPFAMS